MSRIDKVDAAFDVAAAETGVRNDTSHIRVCAASKKRSERWTPEEDEFLRVNLGALSEAEIARRLRRTVTAIQLRWKRDLHLRPPTKRENTITAEQIAIGLGMDGKSIHRLIDRGIMPGRRLPTNGRVIHLVDKMILTRWLLDTANWIYIYPDRVGALRPRGKRQIPGNYDFAYWEEMAKKMQDARLRWNDTWLRPGQVAKMLNTSTHYINTAIRKGTLPAIRWGNWWIRQSSIPRGMTINFRGDWKEIPLVKGGNYIPEMLEEVKVE